MGGWLNGFPGPKLSGSAKLPIKPGPALAPYGFNPLRLLKLLLSPSADVCERPPDNRSPSTKEFELNPSAVSADANAAAPLGFFLFWSLDVAPTMSLNGNTANCCEYLMGNHVIAERAFRHDPMAMLYVPLRIVLFQTAGGPTTFVIEQPSSLLSSLGNADITMVGLDLDKKLANLFKHLEVPCPQKLVGA
jgi:Domain of unknown function DUF302